MSVVQAHEGAPWVFPAFTEYMLKMVVINITYRLTLIAELTQTSIASLRM